MCAGVLKKKKNIWLKTEAVVESLAHHSFRFVLESYFTECDANGWGVSWRVHGVLGACSDRTLHYMFI